MCGFFLFDCVLLIIYTQLSSNRLISRNWNPSENTKKISNSNRSIWRRIYTNVREQQAAERESKERERETGSPPNLTQLKREPRKEGAVAWLAILLTYAILPLSDGRARWHVVHNRWREHNPPRRWGAGLFNQTKTAPHFLFEEEKKETKMGANCSIASIHVIGKKTKTRWWNKPTKIQKEQNGSEESAKRI